MDSIKLIFVVLPGLFLVLGLILAGLSLAASFRRKRSMAGWSQASATRHRQPARQGRPREATAGTGLRRRTNSTDAGGKRWLGQSDIYSQDQAIIGQRIAVRYNPANPAESTLPVFLVARGRLATGLILVLFGAGAITMFGSLSW